MLINIFSFFSFCLFGFSAPHGKSRRVAKYHNKSLKMSKLHNECAILPAFQTTILRTFFELTKFF